MLVKLYKKGELHFRSFDTNGFHVKETNERFTAAGLRCHQNLKYEHFKSSTNCTKKRAARAAWLFFLIQPIKSLNCGVVEAAPVVVSQTPYWI